MVGKKKSDDDEKKVVKPTSVPVSENICPEKSKLVDEILTKQAETEEASKS